MLALPLEAYSGANACLLNDIETCPAMCSPTKTASGWLRSLTIRWLPDGFRLRGTDLSLDLNFFLLPFKIIMIIIISSNAPKLEVPYSLQSGEPRILGAPWQRTPPPLGPCVSDDLNSLKPQKEYKRSMSNFRPLADGDVCSIEAERRLEYMGSACPWDQIIRSGWQENIWAGLSH